MYSMAAEVDMEVEDDLARGAFLWPPHSSYLPFPGVFPLWRVKAGRKMELTAPYEIWILLFDQLKSAYATSRARFRPSLRRTLSSSATSGTSTRGSPF